SLRKFFISSLRASITFLTSFLVMSSSAASVLVIISLLTNSSADLDSSDFSLLSPPLNGSLQNRLISKEVGLQIVIDYSQSLSKRRKGDMTEMMRNKGQELSEPGFSWSNGGLEFFSLRKCLEPLSGEDTCWIGGLDPGYHEHQIAYQVYLGLQPCSPK
ncbi:hypothetical protein STEG23_036958, partial [Scotinomys teguina]